MLPTNGKSLDYIKLKVGSGRYLTHRSTINKFPDGLLAELIDPKNDKRETAEDYIRVGHEGKHFDTVLNLMRTGNLLHAESLRPGEHQELVDELKFHRLSSLAKLIQDEYIEPEPIEMPTDIALVVSNHWQFLQQIQRPLLVIVSPTFDQIVSRLGYDLPSKLFNFNRYDVRVFPSSYDSHPFAYRSDSHYQLCLYSDHCMIAEQISHFESLKSFIFEVLHAVELYFDRNTTNEDIAKLYDYIKIKDFVEDEEEP